jgi:transposase
MSEEYQRIELITGTARRRHWSTEQKLRIIEESFEPGETVSSAARRNGVAPNLLYRWRRLMSEGGVTAVGSDEPVVGNSEVRKLEERVRELERLLGRKTMENEILREALSKANSKKPIWRPLSLPKNGSRRSGLPRPSASPDPIWLSAPAGGRRRAGHISKPRTRRCCR